MNGYMKTAKCDTWETPQDLFHRLDVEFCFNLDVCAVKETAKCEIFYTPEDDAFKHNWNGVCWMNPPYGRDISKWLKKAYSESLNGNTIVCLIPSRTDTKYWHDYCMKATEIRFIKGRLKFGGSKSSAPFSSAIIIFGKRNGELKVSAYESNAST